MRTIYLAGPEVFCPAASELGARKKALCEGYGFRGLFPLDGELQQTSSARELGFAISAANEQLIRHADLVIANLTPFRGASADVGTVYELGLARGLGKVIHGYSNDPASFAERTFALFGQGEYGGSELHDRDGLSIEQFDLHDNLMIEGGIALSGGIFLTHQAAEAEKYSDLTAFEAILSALQKQSR
ncbi:nucleoside 2-deoxyribosyltransferase [Thalassolituus hydrocarboniclasticus]|uniref:Nucleoside 2-deoxyribosyltransferase n=1 Tax=Thalassolituus hydrocarboniclasticus TaxID=2742796 RepID=A0ABY6AE37_9GAMM|nr:nucleoside 2-deoxyribosyltransferase [Thalassolituus hydrocarboniclasticus]